MKAVKLAVALTALAALGGVGAPAAVAAESLYAPDAAAREFNTSAGGWTGTVEADNVLCDLGLTCPAMFNRFEGSGGAAGDGFIRTEMAGLLGVSLLTAERGVWQSPRFTYRGAEGSQPTSVTLGFKRRTDDQTFLNVVGAAATFEARLRDLTSGTVLEAMPASDATDVSGWTAVPEATINPSQLVLGHEYVIEIVTETSVPVAVIPAATFDYDDVVLRATGPEAPGGSRGSGGSGGYNPGSGLAGVLGGKAQLRGSTLLVPVRCPRAAPAKCRVRLVGKLGGRRSKAATKTGKVGVKPGKKKVARLRVKPKFLARVTPRKRMTFRAKVSSGGASVVSYKKLRIVRR